MVVICFLLWMLLWPVVGAGVMWVQRGQLGIDRDVGEALKWDARVWVVVGVILLALSVFEVLS